MSETTDKAIRLSKVAREFNQGLHTVVEFLASKGHTVEQNPNAKIGNIKLDQEHKRAEVYMKPDQVALAIGKGGHNIKLAGKLTGFDIDVYRDSDEVTDDVDLEEFADEIEHWIIDALKGIGCDTARSVLDLRKV